jgi:tRNA U34 5-methylaminomethyl-2-thiouridine-forming methyltransferase MnmC
MQHYEYTERCKELESSFRNYITQNNLGHRWLFSDLEAYAHSERYTDLETYIVGMKMNCLKVPDIWTRSYEPRKYVKHPMPRNNQEF